MTSEEQKIIDIQVKYKDAINGVIQFEKQINELKNVQKQLNEQLEAGDIAVEEFNQQMVATDSAIRQYKDNIRVLRNEIKNNLKQEQEQTGSLKQLRAELANATKAYDELSRAEREGAKGTEMQKHIKDISDELKAAEASTNRFQRNVGNYASGWDGLGMSVQQILREVPSAAVSLNTFFLAISNNIPMLVDQINLLREANKAAAAEGKATTSVWKSLAGAFFSWNTAISLGVTLLTFYGGVLVDWVKNMIKGKQETDYMKEAMEGVNKAMSEGEAEAQKDIVTLNLLYNATQDVTKSLDERRAAVKELQKQYPDYFSNLSEEEILAGKATDAYNRLSDAIIRSARARAAQDKLVENSKKILELETQVTEAYEKQEKASVKLAKARKDASYVVSGGESGQEAMRLALSAAADAEREVTKYGEAADNARKQIYALEKANRELADSININDLVNTPGTSRRIAETRSTSSKTVSSKDTTADDAKAYEEQQQRILEEQRKAQDLLLSLIADEYEQRRQIIATQYDRQIDDLKKRLKEEKDLTFEEQDAITTQIIALREKRNKELEALSNEQMQKDIQAQIDNTNMQLEYAEGEYEKELQLKQQKLDQERELRKLQAQQEIADQEQLRQKLLQIDEEYDAKSLNLLLNSLMVQAAESKAAREAQVQQEQAKWSAIAQMTNAASQLAKSVGEDDKALTALSKTLALATVAINTGVAISKSVAAAAGSPLGFLQIAGIITQVLSAMATATSIIKSAKFAKGGLVTGKGTGTSDSIPARLSNGESVMTAKATSMFSPLLSTFNQLGGGVPITINTNSASVGEDFLAAAVAKGFMMCPAPVVSVEEITRVQKQVRTIQNIARI